MPTLLHISLFLFFVGLVEFLFPINTTVTFSTLSCIVVFVLAYAMLTALPSFYFNCPYATPFSGLTWRLYQLLILGFFGIILRIEAAFHRPLVGIWYWTHWHAGIPGTVMWKAMLKQQFAIRRKWLSDGLRNSVILSASTAPLTVLTDALEWTLTTLDEDKEVEDFVARMPGLFDSRAVPDATSAILPLMSHDEPILGSRLYDLVKTCRPGASFLTEEMRRYRLRVCMKTLWYFGRAYNQLGASHPLPSYFPDALAGLEVIRHVQKEGDTAIRVMGRCFGALTARKLISDLRSRDKPSDGELIPFGNPSYRKS